MKPRLRDLIFIILWPIMASLVSFKLKTDSFITMLLFFAIPAVYFSYYKADAIKKISLFSLILAIPLSIIIDYIMKITNSWATPYSIFGNFRIFKFVTIDNIIWGFLWVYLTVIFYSYYFDKNEKQRSYNKNFKYLVFGNIFLLLLFTIIHFINQSLLYVNYFYLKLGILLIFLPLFLIILKYPYLTKKFLLTGLYFFFLLLIYEITALKLGQWSFPDANQYIGFIHIFGVSLPIEELVFYIMFGSPAIVAYYIFFNKQ